MFTRYSSSLNIPKNYGGSRFRMPPETETKTHRETGPVPHKRDTTYEANYVANEPLKEVDEAEIIDTSPTENENLDYFESCGDEDRLPEKNQQQKQILELKEGFSRLFSSIKKDDLLLVALIILVASSNEGSDFGTTLLLALLLIYH